MLGSCRLDSPCAEAWWQRCLPAINMYEVSGEGKIHMWTEGEMTNNPWVLKLV